MTHSNTSLSAAINKSSLFKIMLLGSGVGLLIILFFITGAETEAHYPNHWKIRPIIITPISAAVGAGFAYVASKFLQQKGTNRLIAILLSIIPFIIAVHMGIVMGLGGTLWD